MMIVPTSSALAAIAIATVTLSSNIINNNRYSVVVNAECMSESSGASITEGAWNLMGVNGTMDPPVLDENNINTQDFTWTIPDGIWSYPHGEMGDYGANYMTQYTCSKLQFCNPKGGGVDDESTAGGKRELRDNGNNGRQLIDEFSEQEIYQMASKDAFIDCNYTDAVLLGTTNATQSCVIVSPKDDLSMDGETDYYASGIKENCLSGQKIAVSVSDYESSAVSCGKIAMHTPASTRLRNCDCMFTKQPFSSRYPGLCAYGYQEECLSIMADVDDECCNSETCFSNMELFDTPEGNNHELSRRTECNDNIPGNCYNMDGVASDISEDGSTDCCSQTCSTCGSELASGAVWETCTSNTPDAMTATCGRLSRYAQTDHICDFTKCPTDSVWGTSNTAIYAYMGIEKEQQQPSSETVTETGTGTTTTTTTTDTETPPETSDDVDESSASITAPIINVLLLLLSTILGVVVTVLI